MTNRIDSIAIIIVMFNPKKEDIDNVERLSKCYTGVIVDNSPSATFQNDTIHKMQYIALNENVGIAKAQNIGIQKSLQNKDIEYIVFLDQDSTASDSYPLDITKAYETIRLNVHKLAFLGPRLENKENGKEYKSILHQEVEAANSFILRNEIISSGGCTTREAIDDIGLNLEKLFIDYVDFEWCWRAKSKGYVCGITSQVVIQHHVGQQTMYIGGYTIIVSSPIRYYYQYRNFIWLLRKRYVPRIWLLKNGIKKIAALFYFPLFIKNGMQCWKHMMRGIGAGITQKGI